jgi:hypothetical protein
MDKKSVYIHVLKDGMDLITKIDQGRSHDHEEARSFY